MHNHANSFISGVAYLARTHPESCTTFMRNPGGTDFEFKNDYAGATQGRVQRRPLREPGAGTGRRAALPELPAARRAAEPRRTSHHARVQRHSDATRFLGLRRPVQRPTVPSWSAAAHRLAGADGCCPASPGSATKSSGRSRAPPGSGGRCRRARAWSPGFFGGIATGAFGLGPRLATSARPLTLVCRLRDRDRGLEPGTAAGLPSFARAASGLLGEEPSLGWRYFVSFAATFLLLMPATAAMGATLPAAERMFRSSSSPGRSLGALYAANTAGAVVGGAAHRLRTDRAYGAAGARRSCASRAT